MIIVTSLRAAQRELQSNGAQRAISILSPDTPHPEFASLDEGQHLRLTFHDVTTDTAGLSAPSLHDAERLIEFISAWDKATPMLIHCWAGISRSTAAAFTTMCLHQKDKDEMELAWELRAASLSATPNRLIVSQVDGLLGRKGRMVKAVEAIGRGADAFEGTPFKLKV